MNFGEEAAAVGFLGKYAFGTCRKSVLLFSLFEMSLKINKMGLRQAKHWLLRSVARQFFEF